MSHVTLCKKCQKEVAPDKRADAIFCSDECRISAHHSEARRRNRERTSYERSIPTRFAAWLAAFEERLRRQAPENAIGYRAGLWYGRDYLWFPIVPAGTNAKGRLRGRLDINRRRAKDEYFSLQPFEPPSVPLATLYQIRFISSVYPYPDMGEAGSFEEAIPYEIKMNNLPIDNLKTLPVRRQRM